MFEQMLQKSLQSSKSTEKSSVDKFLAKDDIQSIKELMSKENLSRPELVELLYMCSSSECKLWNFSEFDRYLMNKFFVWIQEFIKIAEHIFDYKAYLQKQENTCTHCKGWIKSDTKINITTADWQKCTCQTPTAGAKISKRTWQQLDNVIKMHEHNCKFMVNLYLNIGRTSLSIGATAFLEMLKNKWEVIYPSMGTVQTPAAQQPQQIRPASPGKQ